jgi:putative thiamine transport system ATP-binding protein
MARMAARSSDAAMSGTGLALHDVRIAIASHVIVPRLELRVAPGECVTVMGPSGSGKSTLLAYIAGTLAAPFDGAGRVTVDDIDVSALAPEARRIGILFQDDLLFPHL